MLTEEERAEFKKWLASQGLPTNVDPAVLLRSPDSLTASQRRMLEKYVRLAGGG